MVNVQNAEGYCSEIALKLLWGKVRWKGVSEEAQTPVDQARRPGFKST